jgi:hypothetical protein
VVDARPPSRALTATGKRRNRRSVLAELWAKYAGAVDYDQRHHRDFVNHGLVVPKRSDPATQMASWMLLSDVGEDDGPTKIVPRSPFARASRTGRSLGITTSRTTSPRGCSPRRRCR